MTKKFCFAHLVPVYNLRLTGWSTNRIKVRDTTFVEKDRFCRNKTIYGIKISPRYWQKWKRHNQAIWDKFECIGIVHLPTDDKTAPNIAIARQMVRRDLFALTALQLGYAGRHFTSQPDIFDNWSISSVASFEITENKQWHTDGRVVRPMGTFHLDERWLRWSQMTFASNLLAVINQETVISSSWQNTLFNAAVRIGKSLSSISLEDALLNGMIALELMLVSRNETTRDTLPLRVEDFLGWSGKWSNLQQRILNLYNKRNEIAHRGHSEIGHEDIILLDDILFNILCNIAKNLSALDSIEAVKAFSERRRAAEILGLPSDEHISVKLISITRHGREREIEILKNFLSY
jgi:hypothetical protein